MVTAETREFGYVVETAATQGGRKHMEDEAVVARVGDPVGRQVLLVGIFEMRCINSYHKGPKRGGTREIPAVSSPRACRGRRR